MSEENSQNDAKKETIEINYGGFLNKARANPWMVATFVCAIMLVFVLVNGGFGGASASVSAEEAGENIIDYINSNPAITGEASLVSSEREGQFYQVVVNYEGQEIPVFATLDGEFMVTNPVPLSVSEVPSATQPSDEVVKSDRPEVELYIWSYCPYGVIAQGPLAEVAQLLGDKADFKAVMYHDGHGDYETQQNMIQECIQKNAADKYWDYAAGFVKTVYPECSSSRDVECDKGKSIELMKAVGINSDEIMSCVESEGEALIGSAVTLARESGVSGSPTLMINGVKSNSARTAEAYKTAICEAFNEAPAECEQVLSSDSGTATGNC